MLLYVTVPHEHDINTNMGPQCKNCSTTKDLFHFKGAMKTKHKFGFLKRLLCHDNKYANFIAKFKQVTRILRKTHDMVATHQPLSTEVSVMSQTFISVIGSCRLKTLAKKHDWVVVVGPPVLFDHLT